jgi:hypothetical protein
MRIVEYHRRNLANPGRDEYGRPVTVFSTGIRIPKGKYKGKFVSVPGFIEGRIPMKNGKPDERKIFEYWEKEIDEGKWPMYEDDKALSFRSQTIHNIMDRESNGY